MQPSKCFAYLHYFTPDNSTHRNHMSWVCNLHFTMKGTEAHDEANKIYA